MSMKKSKDSASPKESFVETSNSASVVALKEPAKVVSFGGKTINNETALFAPRKDKYKDDEDLLNTESMPLDLKPRFTKNQLRDCFFGFIRDVTNSPIEYYEAILYEASADYMLKLNMFNVSMRIVDSMHHIYKLKQMESDLTHDELERVNAAIEKIIERHPSALEEYKLFLRMIDIMNAMMVKWNIVHHSEYSYRMAGRTLNIKVLDLVEINKSVMSMEVIFLSRILDEHPLSTIIEESTRQYSIVLHQEIVRIMKFMLTMNNVNFREHPSISGYLARIVPELVSAKHMQPNFVQEPPEYQELRIPIDCISRFVKTRTQAKAIRLMKLLRDLEVVYRCFEKSLVANILQISNQQF